MTNTDRQQAAIGLLRDYMGGRIDRRQLLKSAAAAGALLPVLTIMRGQTYVASAQDASPAAEAPGYSIVVPEGLRTDLAGKEIAWMGPTASDADLPWNQAAVQKFIDATGINVSIVNGENQTDARLQAMRNQFAAQSSDIDVYQIDIIWPGVVAEHAVDLAPAFGDAVGTFFPGIIEANTVDGVLSGIPWFTDAGLLFYRTDLLEKYGLQPPVTWTDLETSAQTVLDGEKEANPDFTGFLWQGKAYEGLTCNGLEWLVSQGGGTIIDTDRNITVDNELAIAAMDRAAKWVNGISPEGVTTYTEQETFNVWVAGNAVFARNWPYMFAASQDSDATRGLVGFSPLPKGDGAEDKSAATIGGWSMMVSKYSEEQDAAIEFTKYMVSPELQLSYAIERTHMPTIPSVYDAPELAEASDFIPQMKSIFDGAVGRPSAQTGDLYPEISTVFYQQLNQALAGAQSAADAAAQMKEDMQAVLDDE